MNLFVYKKLGTLKFCFYNNEFWILYLAYYSTTDKHFSYPLGMLKKKKHCNRKTVKKNVGSYHDHAGVKKCAMSNILWFVFWSKLHVIEIYIYFYIIICNGLYSIDTYIWFICMYVTTPLLKIMTGKSFYFQYYYQCEMCYSKKNEKMFNQALWLWKLS